MVMWRGIVPVMMFLFNDELRLQSDLWVQDSYASYIHTFQGLHFTGVNKSLKEIFQQLS